MLWTDLGLLGLGLTFMVLGTSAGMVFGLTWARSVNRGGILRGPLLPFACFAVIYGARLLTIAGPMRKLTPIPDTAWLYGYAWLTYAAGPPAVLFLGALLDERWPSWMKWAFRIPVVGLPVGVVVDLAAGRPNAWETGNNILIMGCLLLLSAGFEWPAGWTARERWVTGGSLGICGGAIALTNLTALGVTGVGRSGGYFALIEGPSLLLFTSAIGWVVLERTLAGEEELRRIRGELDLARRIQRSLLPASELKVAGATIATCYEPMTEMAGDFYDWVVPEPGRLAVLVADVSGHGIAAALIASAVKVAFRAGRKDWESPSQVLTQMNRALWGVASGQFVTAAYLYLNLESGEGQYAAAGHPPALKVARDGGSERVEANGLPLGLFPQAQYSERMIRLEEGDRIYVCTDGVLEAQNGAAREFEERYQELATARRGAAEIWEELRGWQGATATDDATLVVLERGQCGQGKKREGPGGGAGPLASASSDA